MCLELSVAQVSVGRHLEVDEKMEPVADSNLGRRFVHYAWQYRRYVRQSTLQFIPGMSGGVHSEFHHDFKMVTTDVDVTGSPTSQRHEKGGAMDRNCQKMILPTESLATSSLTAPFTIPG